MIMNKKPLISVIIVGYNAAGHIAGCIDFVYGQSYDNFEIIFIDNGSVDNTGDILKLYPGIKVIKNKENKGFAAANNQGIKASAGEYVLTLNSDVILDKGFLSEMEKAAKEEGAALLSGKILRGREKAIDSTGLVLSRLYRFFDRGSGEIDTGQYDKKRDIFGPCAAAALYKREMLEDIKQGGEYFDEAFFFLGEDFDLAYRAGKKGWKAGFVPDAVCYHTRNSTRFNNKFRQYLSFRNRFFFLIKNNILNFRYIPVFLVYDMPRFLYMLFINRYTLKAVREIFDFAGKISVSGASRAGAKPHILSIVQRYHPAIGGAEAYIKEISERSVKDGRKATVFTTDAWDLEHLWKRGKRSIKCRKETCKGVTIERFKAVKFPFHNILMRVMYQLPFLPAKALFSLPSPVVPSLWKRLFFGNKDNFDAVHVSAFPYNSLIYMGIRYARKRNIPVVCTPFIHLGERENNEVSKYYTRDFQVKLLDKCDRIIVQTSVERDYLRSAGIDNKKIFIVGQGINIEDIMGGSSERFRQRFNITEKKIVFHVAAKSRDKGTFHLIEAMKSIWKEDEDVKLVLAGPPMEEFSRYFSGESAFVKRKTLEMDYVTGDDKKDLFAAGDVFVMPSRTDSFGIVFLEAWANKKPVIGARAGGVTEVIRHGEDGYLSRFGDTQEIAHYIEKLLSDKKLADKMAEKGHLRVIRDLTWDMKYQKLREVLSVSDKAVK